MSNKKVNIEPAVIEQLLAQVKALTDEVARLKERPVAIAKKDRNKGDPRPGVFWVILGYPKEKHPPQCLRVMRALAAAAPEGGRMSEIEVWNALMGPETKLGPWNYKQTAFYCFKYYKVPMVDGDYLRGPLGAE